MRRKKKLDFRKDLKGMISIEPKISKTIDKYEASELTYAAALEKITTAYIDKLLAIKEEEKNND